jgi:hypothetical protein
VGWMAAAAGGVLAAGGALVIAGKRHGRHG